MVRHIVIADAGPLIALARIDALPLLKGVFGRVCITRTVHDEILPPSSFFDEASALTQALTDGWIRVVETDWAGWQPLNPGVDAGEASSIHVACLWQKAGDAVLLVIDDRAGRAEARTRGLALIGTAAVIGLAKTRGLVPAAQPLLEQLQRSGYYLGRSVIDAVLTEIGER
jgi:predicted nucleic acid-binding protein